MIPGGEKVQEMDFRGTWRDDKNRIVRIINQNSDGSWEGIRKGEIHTQTYTQYLGVNIQDGSRLMERKRGEEGGWD